MERINLSVHPKDATTKILKTLSSKRAEDVLAKRFGIKGPGRHTLESIGKSYGITRERVRQIEEAGMKALAENNEVQKELQALHPAFRNHLSNHGGVSEEKRYLNSLADEKFHPHVNFILSLGKPVHKAEEDDNHHHRWFVDDETLNKAQTVVSRVVDELDVKKTVVSEDGLADLFANHAREVFGEPKDEKSIKSYMSIAKSISKNPYNEYGLVSWPDINPRGVRDKAYVVLAKHEKPLHFTEVAKAINKSGWSRRTAHPQTVHNELIKDNRFVLVGRGLYALKQWGYEPGTVKDVLVSVLKQSVRPMSKDEITKKVLEKRMVKENTILLNLQDKKKFKRAGEGYTLV